VELPKSRKGAQLLTGRLASLNRFISRSTERNLPFFEVLKSPKVFQWGPIQKIFRRLEVVPYTVNNPNSTFIRRSTVIVCSCLSFYNQCSAGPRKARWADEETSTSLLRFRSLESVKKKLHRVREGTICHIDGLYKVSELFSILSYNSIFASTLEIHHKK
jgi:hypothetical protein